MILSMRDIKTLHDARELQVAMRYDRAIQRGCNPLAAGRVARGCTVNRFTAYEDMALYLRLGLLNGVRP